MHGSTRAGPSLQGLACRDDKVNEQIATTLNETHRFRTVFSFNVGWKIVGDFKFSVQIDNSYDSQPPGTDAIKTDVTLVTSIGYTFSWPVRPKWGSAGITIGDAR